MFRLSKRISYTDDHVGHAYLAVVYSLVNAVYALYTMLIFHFPCHS